MKIVIPSDKYKEAYFKYIAEVESNNELNKIGESRLKNNESFEEMLDRLRYISDPNNLNNQATTVFWLIKDNEIIGSMNLRHDLNEWTYFTIGNIGFYVRPSERNKGYATRALAYAKDFYRKLGKQKILLICYKNNKASERVILKNNGVFELEIKDFKTDNILRRYWIEL